MWEKPKNFKIKIGGSYFIDCENLITYHGESLFRRIERRDNDGKIGLDFDVYDNKGHKVATIRRGNVVEGDKDAYQIEHLADCHRVTEKSTGKVLVEINKSPPDADIAISVSMYMPDGFLLEATPDSLNIESTMMIGCTIERCKTAIGIGS